MTQFIQIAGQKCTVCGKNIFSAGHGVACLSCELVFCNDCAMSECPECQKNFEQQEIEKEAHEREEAVIRLNQGKRRKSVVNAILIALPIVSIIASLFFSISREERLHLYEEARPLGLLFVLMGGSMYYCANWARNFFLYRWSVQRAIRWYGETISHLGYAFIGLIQIAIGTWILSANLQ